MLQVKITDGVDTNRTAAVVDGNKETPSLAVATRPLKTFENSVRFFSSDIYGTDMNINAEFGGTPEVVYKDNAEWTTSDIVGGGKTTFNSTDFDHTDDGGDAFSIKVDNSPIGDIYQLAKGSDIDANNYTAITLWIYVDKDWKTGTVTELSGWDTGTGLDIGTAVNLTNYFSFSTFKVWQKLVIPLLDMGSLETYSTLDALRIKQTASGGGKAPKYYMDDIQFEKTGTPGIFLVEPTKGTWLHVNEFMFSFADALTGTVSDGTMPGISYDKILGETLTAGFNYQRTQGTKLIFSSTIKTIMDILQLPCTDVSSIGSDGTNTFVTIKAVHSEPLILKHENTDKLQFTVSEDLTGLLHFRISAGCSIEERVWSDY